MFKAVFGLVECMGECGPHAHLEPLVLVGPNFYLGNCTLCTPMATLLD